MVEEESLSSPSPSLGSNDYQLFLLSLAICNTGLCKCVYVYLSVKS